MNWKSSGKSWWTFEGHNENRSTIFVAPILSIM
jgi:hypothetical protein